MTPPTESSTRTEWVVRGRWAWRPSWLIALGFDAGCALQGHGWGFRTFEVAIAIVMAIPKKVTG